MNVHFTLDTNRLQDAVSRGDIDPDPLTEPLQAFSERGADHALTNLYADAENAGAIAGPDGLELAVYAVGDADDLATLITLRPSTPPFLQISDLSVDTDDLCRLDAPAVQALQAVCDHANQRLLPHAGLLPRAAAI